MKICKVKGCNRKIDCKGYCQGHYTRKYRYNQPLHKYCIDCSLELGFKGQKRCKKCALLHHNKQMLRRFHELKGTITQFNFLGRRINIYTNGVTEELKPLIPKIKDDVLNDCIKNPRKYLGERTKSSTK